MIAYSLWRTEQGMEMLNTRANARNLCIAGATDGHGVFCACSCLCYSGNTQSKVHHAQRFCTDRNGMLYHTRVLFSTFSHTISQDSFSSSSAISARA